MRGLVPRRRRETSGNEHLVLEHGGGVCCGDCGAGLVSMFDDTYRLQGGRCWLCQAWTLPQNLTRAHLVPRAHGGTIGEDWSGAVLMHESCNAAMGCLHVGSTRFEKWIKRVVKHGYRDRFRRDAFVHNAT